MKLNMLREHYRRDFKTNNWVPKKSFSSIEEMREQVSADIDTTCHIYTCSICGSLHIASMQNKREDKNAA